MFRRLVLSLFLFALGSAFNSAFASGSYYIESYSPLITVVNGVNKFNCSYDGMLGNYHQSTGTCSGHKLCVDPAIPNDDGDGCMLPDGATCGAGMTWDAAQNACVNDPSPPPANDGSSSSSPVRASMDTFVAGLTGALEIVGGVLVIASFLALIYATIFCCRRLFALLRGRSS